MDFLSACRYGNLDTTKNLILHQTDDTLYEGLCIAAKCGHTIIVRLLLDHGVDFRDYTNYVFQWASFFGYAGVVDLMVSRVLSSDSSKTQQLQCNLHEALCWSAYRGCTEVVKVLLRHGVDPCEKSYMALRWASQSQRPGVLRVMLDHGVNLRAEDDRMLDEAAAYGSLENVRFLVETGKLDVNSGKGRALNSSAHGGHLQIVQYLVSKGADAQKKSAIQDAARGGHLPIVQFLYQFYDNSDLCKNNLSGALSAAVSNGSADVVEFLLGEAKVAPDSHTHIAMVAAASSGYLRTIRTLVEHYPTLSKNKLALEFATSSGNLNIIQYLVDHGAVISDVLFLDKASEFGHLPVVRYIVGRSSRFSLSPVKKAADEMHWNVVSYFLHICASPDLLRGVQQMLKGNKEYANFLTKLVGIMKGRFVVIENNDDGRDINLVDSPYYDGNIGMIVCSYL